MSVAIPNLWPVNTINIDVLTPIVILRSQAANLASATKGVLTAEIETVSMADGKVKHQFDLVATALSGYRHRLLTATHSRDMVYPVKIEAPGYSPGIVKIFDPYYGAIATEQAFIEQLKKILGSDYTLSIIQSLLARSNEIDDVGTQADDQGNQAED